MQRIALVFLFLLCHSSFAAEKPDLLLAISYKDSLNVQDYWVSEKLDGVRAYWDGKQLISRNGNIYPAPDWFVAKFPATALDGELWLTRGKFEKILSIVSQQQADDALWQQMGYYVFELPYGTGTFSQRLVQLKNIVAQQSSPYLHFVPQFRIQNREDLYKKLHEIVKEGGEGLMLHHQDALYSTGRNGDLLKLKTYEDAEATVVDYRLGKGKYRGQVRSLVVETEQGKRFAIGSGLSEDLLENPPVIGSLITFRYNGLTRKGTPRFARFLRVRQKP